MKRFRVLFRARNRRGLGHLVRVRNIADALSDRYPAATVAVHATHQPHRLLWDDGVALTTDESLGWDRCVAEFGPDVIVHDTVIDLPATWDTASNVLILRRRSAERHNDLMADELLRTIDRVVVPHTPAEFGLELAASIADRTTFVGPIVRLPRSSRAIERARLGIADHRLLVTATAGGGGFTDQADRFLRCVDAIVEAAASADVAADFVVICGPNYRSAEIYDRLARHTSTRMLLAHPRLVDLLGASDVVIAEGGYNTAAEIQACRVPAVFIPSQRGLDDQFERVARIATTGAAIVLDGTDAEGDAANAVMRVLTSPARRAQMMTAADRYAIVPGNDIAADVIAEVAARRVGSWS